MKYLGVHLDNSLKFETHVNEKIKAARKALYAARSKVKGAFGPHPRSLKWVYEGVALPIVTYACHYGGIKQKGKHYSPLTDKAAC